MSYAPQREPREDYVERVAVPIREGLAVDKDAAFDFLDEYDALAARLAAVEAALRGTKPPYRIAGIPPGIISADDCDVTEPVLEALAALASGSGT